MKMRDFLENFILIAIILVIVHTFLYELSIYQHWNVSLRNKLIVSALFFDLLFSVEFIVRSSYAGGFSGFKKYFFYERGWVDFLSSWPLLLLDSGPSVYLLFFGGLHDAGSAIGALNILKVVKAIRVTRILRLVRIIKIFGKIHNAESKMAQHHTASISTTAVFTIVLALIGFAFFTDSTGQEEIQKRKIHYVKLIDSVERMHRAGKISPKETVNYFFSGDENILEIKYSKRTLLSGIDRPGFKEIYSDDDYIKIIHGDYSLTVSVVDVHRRIALNHMESFIIIVAVVFAFMLIYTRHFVQNISDPLHIMNKGFRKKDYNLQVAVEKYYSDHEVNRLARFYNDAYLPAKLKRYQNRDSQESGLSMNDLLNFKK